jgi:hypothetical protein
MGLPGPSEDGWISMFKLRRGRQENARNSWGMRGKHTIRRKRCLWLTRCLACAVARRACSARHSGDSHGNAREEGTQKGHGFLALPDHHRRRTLTGTGIMKETADGAVCTACRGARTANPSRPERDAARHTILRPPPPPPAAAAARKHTAAASAREVGMVGRRCVWAALSLKAEQSVGPAPARQAGQSGRLQVLWGGGGVGGAQPARNHKTLGRTRMVARRMCSSAAGCGVHTARAACQCRGASHGTSVTMARIPRPGEPTPLSELPNHPPNHSPSPPPLAHSTPPWLQVLLLLQGTPRLPSAPASCSLHFDSLAGVMTPPLFP